MLVWRVGPSVAAGASPDLRGKEARGGGWRVEGERVWAGGLAWSPVLGLVVGDGRGRWPR